MRSLPAASGRGDRAGLALGLVLGAAVAWNLAANLWLPWALYVPGALVLATTLVGVATRLGGCRWGDLGLDHHELRRGLAYGAVVAVAVTAVLGLGAALPATRGLFQDRRAEGISTAMLLYVTLVRVPLGTVVLEETLFRGVLLGLGMRRWSQTTAVTISCLAFGVWHMLPARNLTLFTPVFADLAGGQLDRVYAVEPELELSPAEEAVAAELVDKPVLEVRRQPDGPRFRMLKTIQAFGRQPRPVGACRAVGRRGRGRVAVDPRPASRAREALQAVDYLCTSS